MGDARQHDRCGSAPSAQLKLTAAQKRAALMVATGFTIYALATRFVRNDGPWISLFLKGFFGLCFSSIVVPFFWQPIALNEVPVIAALAVFWILGHLLMIRAFATTPASNIAPYGYAGLLFAIIFGLTLYDESPDLITLLGAFVIVGVGLYVWSHERLTQAQKTHG